MTDRLELPSLARILEMSGLEFMQRIAEGSLPPAPMASLMNFAVEEVAEDRVAFRGSPEPRHCNPMSGVHGGWYGTILDSALGCAVMTRVPRRRIYTTLEYKVNLTRAIPVGTDVVCEALCDHAGRSTAIAHGEIRGVADGKLYATGSTTCLIMQPG